MILLKHVVGKLSRYGFMMAAALGMAAWPGWSAGQAAPPDQAPSPAPPLEARLQKIEATLELILRHLKDGEGTTAQDSNRRPNAGGRKLTLRPLTTEFTGDEGTILDAADRRYEIAHENGRSALLAIEPSSGLLVWQSDLGTGVSVDKATWQLSKTEDGKLLRVEAACEDSSLAFTIDAETGRTIKQEIAGNSAPRVTVVGPRRVPLGPSTARYFASTAFRSRPPALSAPGAAQDEFVVLATSYVDAIGSWKLARSKYEQLKAQRNSAAAPAGELDAAAIHLETAQRKVAILAAAVQGACDTARAELEFAESMYEAGFLTPNQLAALAAKIKTLESVVQQRSAAGAPSSSGPPPSFAPRK